MAKYRESSFLRHECLRSKQFGTAVNSYRLGLFWIHSREEHYMERVKWIAVLDSLSITFRIDFFTRKDINRYRGWGFWDKVTKQVFRLKKILLPKVNCLLLYFFRKPLIVKVHFILSMDGKVPIITCTLCNVPFGGIVLRPRVIGVPNSKALLEIALS